MLSSLRISGIGTATMGHSMVVLKRVDIELPCDPAIPLLGTYPKDLKAWSRRDVCTPIFIALLFTIAKRWKQPKCPSMDEWINKM